MRALLFVIPLLAACGGDTRVEDILALTGDAVAGEAVFTANCESCHGVGATGGSGPELVGHGADEEHVEVVIDGEEDMPAFGDTLSDQDIADVLAYTGSL